MIEFRILKESKKSRARRGVLKTPHGEIETPAFVPVATQGVIKTLASEEVREAGTQILIANTLHLHAKTGEHIVKKAGSLHAFMNWQRPLMTDSGGFQVFSFGFGRDFGGGKIAREARAARIKAGEQPKHLKITDRGAHFISPFDGRRIFLGPAESVKIQEALGADIMFAFDECTSPYAGYEYTKQSLVRTHQWARESLAAKKSKQALFGIVQGGRFRDLRRESARHIGSLPFDGFGIGGEFGNNKKTMDAMLAWVVRELPQEKPRHLLGIGRLEDIPKIIAQGIDTFDCIVPTHYGRRGIAFTSSGWLDMMKKEFLAEQKPLDRKCSCFVCGAYLRSYISHLFRTREITGMRLVTFHNLHFFNRFVRSLRERIQQGKL